MKYDHYIAIGIILSVLIVTYTSFQNIQLQIIDEGNKNTIIKIIYDISNKLSLAFLASSIFYYITIVRPRNNDRKNVQEYISPRIVNIIHDCKTIFQSLTNKINLRVEFSDLTEGDFRTICRDIKLKDRPNVDSGRIQKSYNNISEQLQVHKENTIENIRDILMCIHLLDTEFVKLLDSISQCRYFKSPEWNAKTENVPAESDKYLYEYFKLIIHLEKYAKDKNMIKDIIN